MKRLSIFLTAVVMLATSYADAQNFDGVRDSISSRVRLFASGSIRLSYETDSFRNEVMRLFIKVFDARNDLDTENYYYGIITDEERDEILKEISSLRMNAFSLMNDMFYAYILGVGDGQDARAVDEQMMVCCMTLSMISGSLKGFFIEQARSIAASDTWYAYPNWYMIVSLFDILLLSEYYDREAQYAKNPEDIEKEMAEEVIVKLTKLNSYFIDILENHGHDVDMEEHIDYVNGLLREMTKN